MELVSLLALTPLSSNLSPGTEVQCWRQVSSWVFQQDLQWTSWRSGNLAQRILVP